MVGENKALKNLREAFEFEFGRVHEAYLEGEKDFPKIEEIKEEIYSGAMNDKYSNGVCWIGMAPKEMSLLSEEESYKYIDGLFAADERVKEIPWEV